MSVADDDRRFGLKRALLLVIVALDVVTVLLFCLQWALRGFVYGSYPCYVLAFLLAVVLACLTWHDRKYGEESRAVLTVHLITVSSYAGAILFAVFGVEHNDEGQVIIPEESALAVCALVLLLVCTIGVLMSAFVSFGLLLRMCGRPGCSLLIYQPYATLTYPGELV